jgi:hypothetical protein
VLKMKWLLERSGFTLLTADLLPEKERRGNSMLVVATPRESNYTPAFKANYKASVDLDNWQTYSTFSEAVGGSLKKLRTYVRSRNKEGKRLAGYGAGGRGVMMLAMAGLGREDLVYLCDQKPGLHGFFTPGSHVLVTAPSRLLKDPVDEVIVFSYGYMDEIKEQLGDYVKQGGRLISFLELM